MNETVVYSLLTAILLLCYLIALRCRNILRDVECMHDFVHMLADHPILGMVLTHRLHEDHEEPDDQEVPPAFKQWDES